MNASTLAQIVRLRLLVGFLGERSQFNWWPSAFFISSSSAFLSPIFTKTAFTAQYHGVKEAASRVHDEHIGVGKVYHLFRLPETVEQTLFGHLQDPGFIDSDERPAPGPRTSPGRPCDVGDLACRVSRRGLSSLVPLMSCWEANIWGFSPITTGQPSSETRMCIPTMGKRRD